MTTIVKYYHTESADEWAARTLNPTDLAAFNAAAVSNRTRWEEYAAQGRITIEPILEDVYVPASGHTVSITIGEKTIIAAGFSLSDVTLDPLWVPWLDRYNAETNPPAVTIQ
jgi:hypothetical protein